MYCYKCGKQIEDGVLFCGYCGARQPQDGPDDEPDNWTSGIEYYAGRTPAGDGRGRMDGAGRYGGVNYGGAGNYGASGRYTGPLRDDDLDEDEDEERGLGKFPVLLIVLFVVLFLVAAALVYLVAGKSGQKKSQGQDNGDAPAQLQSETLLVGEDDAGTGINGGTAGADQNGSTAEAGINGGTAGAGDTSPGQTPGSGQESTPVTETEKPEENSGSTYQVIAGDYSWAEAEEYCREQGGHLATITSAAEQQQIESAVNASGASLQVLWLGATNTGTMDGSFAWITEETMTYTNWAPGEPSGTDQGTVEENYLVMYRGDGAWKWNDVPGEIAMYYSGDMGFVMEIE